MKCESCGVEFENHLGIIGTCAKLIKVEAEVEQLRKENELLKEMIPYDSKQSTVDLIGQEMK